MAHKRSDNGDSGTRPFLDNLKHQVERELTRSRRTGQRGPMLEHFLEVAERYVRKRRTREDQ